MESAESFAIKMREVLDSLSGPIEITIKRIVLIQARDAAIRAESAEQECDEARILKDDAENILQSWKYRAEKAEAERDDGEKMSQALKQAVIDITAERDTLREWQREAVEWLESYRVILKDAGSKQALDWITTLIAQAKD